MTVEELHAYAREIAGGIVDIDRKQLRFNDIVSCALKFYAADPVGGVRELVESCDRRGALYVKAQPMWQTLEAEYAWILEKVR